MADFPSKQSKINKPLLIVCPPGFDQDFPNASTIMRIGFANGWAEECGPARLVPIAKLMSESSECDKPAIFLTLYDYDHLSKSDSLHLRKYDVFVWIGIHPRKIAEYRKKHSLVLQNDMNIVEQTRHKILLSEPKFVWNSTCSSAMHWYQGWQDDGLKWVTMHPAVDTTKYYPDVSSTEFKNVRMAYVGGYWKEKAQAFDMYLRQWEDILVPYGYQAWPYTNYAGMISEAEERQLYSTAGLIPLVTSPLGWDLGEMTERYFKAPACKAFCISDQNPAVREVFAPDEVLQADSPEHFHKLVRDYLDGRIDTDRWAERGYDAVMRKHLYKHRAQQIIDNIKSM